MKTPQNSIDKILVTLPEEEKNYFLKMARHNANYGDLQKFLNKKANAKISINAIARWFKYNKPTGTEARIINELIKEWEGINPNSLIHLSAGITANLILKIKDAIEIEATSEATKLTNLIELLKELRQISVEINKVNQEKDTTEIYKSGAIALGAEVIKIFKGSPIYPAIEKAVHSAINKICQ